MFNIGDRVRVVDSASTVRNSEFFSIGNVGTIIKIHSEGTYYVFFDRGQEGVRYEIPGEGKWWYVSETSLEKIND